MNFIVSTVQASAQLNSSQNCHGHFNNTQTVGNTAYMCIPVDKTNKKSNVPSQKSKTCAIKGQANRTTYMRQYMRKRRPNESNDDRAKRLKGQRDAYKERKSMLGQVISLFHSLVSKGLMYKCSCCDELWYSHSVILAETLKSSNNGVGKYILGNKSFDNKEWLCNSCHKYLKKNKVAPQAAINGLQFPKKPEFF